MASLSAWGRLVAVSAAVVVGCLLGLAAWGVASTDRRVTSYDVRGALNGIDLDLGGADAEIVGGGGRPSVAVEGTDRSAFGHRAAARRAVVGGILRIRSRCPRTVLHTCSASYRLTVPDNIPVAVRTRGGDVRFNAFKGSARIATGSGDVDVRSFCGFALRVRSETGDVAASARCAPEQMSLRSRTGAVRALLPRGRYRVDAETDTGTRRLRGLRSDEAAPFQIQALSSSGDVMVATGP